MLRISALSKSYGGDPVLRDVSFVLSPGDRAGLVGANGAGKSTLLKLIAGGIEPDAGSVGTDPADRVAYLPQYPDEDLHLSVREALLRGAGDVSRLEAPIAQLAHDLQAAGPADQLPGSTRGSMARGVRAGESGDLYRGIARSPVSRSHGDVHSGARSG